MKSSNIGGQAVLEGIMMKNKDVYAVAVRKPDGEIVVEKDTFHSCVGGAKALTRIPFIRGIFNFIDSLVLGVKTLMFSSQFFEEEETKEELTKEEEEKRQKKENAIMGATVAFSVVLAVAIFMILPYFLSALMKPVVSSYHVRTIIEGFIRIAIFILYVLLISRMEDIQRTFMYHGAEHKTIYCYESGLELTVENAKKFTTLHPRCGTNFLFIVMATSIILFSFFGWPNILVRIIMRILCIPIVAGISYEIIKFLGKYNNILSKIVAYPGMMLQHITTNEPEDDQLEVAIKALKAVI